MPSNCCHYWKWCGPFAYGLIWCSAGKCDGRLVLVYIFKRRASGVTWSSGHDQPNIRSAVHSLTDDRTGLLLDRDSLPPLLDFSRGWHPLLCGAIPARPWQSLRPASTAAYCLQSPQMISVIQPKACQDCFGDSHHDGKQQHTCHWL